MSDSFEETPPEIKSLDELNAGKAFGVGVISTCLMSLVPGLNQACCIHYCIGAFLTIWVYTSSNQATIPVGHGIWVSFKAVLVGTLFGTAIYWGYTFAQNGGDLTVFKEQIFEGLAAQGRDDPSIREMIDKWVPDEAGPGFIALASIAISIGAVFSSLFGAAIGGSLGAAVFKKGTLAQ